MSRKKPAPDLIRGGRRFSEKDMRKKLRLEVLRRPLHRLVPDLVAIFLENQVDVVWRRVPGAARELVFKLTGAPARITKRNQAVLWPAFRRDVAQDFVVRGHRNVVIDVEGVGT